MTARLLEHLSPGPSIDETTPDRIAVEQRGLHAAAGRAAGPAFARQPVGGGNRHVHQDGGRHHLVHQTELERFRRPLTSAGQDDVEGGPGSDELRQSVTPTGTGKQTELHLRKAQLGLGMIRRHPPGAGQRQLEPEAKARPVNGDDDRLGKRLDPVDEGMGLATRGLRVGCGDEGHELIDVGSGNEAVGLAGADDDRADRWIGSETIERRPEFGGVRVTERVDRFAGHVERDDGHALLPPLDREDRHQTRSSTMAKPIPPCAQIEIKPNWTSRRTISLARVVAIRAPVAPKG